MTHTTSVRLSTGLIATVLLFAATAGYAATNRAAQEHCLTQAIYFEARGEGVKGMIAVGAVVMNRVQDSRFPDSICQVVRQGGEQPPCQFSWWCDGKSDRPTNAQAWREARSIARKLANQAIADPTRGALYFHSTGVNPRWRLRRVGRIGGHIFYRQD